MELNKITLFIIVLLHTIGVVAQQSTSKHFELNWKNNTSYTIKDNNSIVTSIVENNFLNDDLIPQYIQSWKIEDNLDVRNFVVSNVKYENFTPINVYLKQSSSISSNFSVDFRVVKQRGKSFGNIECIPIIKEGESYKRVISFNLTYTLSSSIKASKYLKQSSVKNSVLSSGEWFKFAIDTTGVFKLDRSFLQSLGIDISNVNPKNIQIYGNGGAMLPFANNEFRYDGLQENAIKIIGEDDGSFDSGDYILFYAQGPHSWNGDGENLSNYKHNYNIFSDEAYYFVTVGNSEGKRIENSPEITDASVSEITKYHDYVFYEKDEVNLFTAGQQWFGESFIIENTQNFSIPFSNLDTAENVLVRVRGVVASSLSSSMSIKVSGQDLFTINYPAYSGLTDAYAVDGSGEIDLTNSDVNVEVSFNNNGNPSANAYLDYIEILGVKNLIAEGNQFTFRNLEVTSSADIIEYSIVNSDQIYEVWNVTDFINPTVETNNSTSNTFNFKSVGGSLKEFIVLNENDFYTPKKIESTRIENQNLHSLNNIDYLVITQDYLMTQGQRLADYHTENGLISKVIDLNEIYNEFSSGSKDITAIRDFLRHLYLNSTTNQIKYVCLLGDASYDYKDRITGNNNIVPVFEAYNSFNLATSYVTDDYYGMMDENEGLLSSFEKQDISIGRIPITTVNEAEKIIDKILNYYSEATFGQWRTNLTLVADDLDNVIPNGNDEAIQTGMEIIADDITANKPLFNIKKIYMDSYTQESSVGGTRYPDVNTDLTNQIETGTLMVNYFGHGGEDGWATERILEVSDIQSWNNFEKLPLFITVTCEFSKFDNPIRDTAGEYVLWNENGGAASLITTAREVYISFGQSVNRELVKYLLEYNNENYSIAESLLEVKNNFSNSQRYFIYYFGDPAMHLAVPNPKISITKLNDVDVNQELDTIKGLSLVKMQGEVLDINNQLLNNFNGEISATFFDKGFVKTTLDNDNHGIFMDYDVNGSKIFNGRATVENGMFEFEFFTPRDLKIEYGNGRLSMYANNTIEDRSGYNLDIVVGGINENAPEDSKGPTVQLYMNDLTFVEGGTTNQSPLFIAVLEDESGINTSITAVDHDIVAIIDGDQSNPIILNDYYQTELDDFTKGKASYQLSDLEPGLHTITLKAWDSYNNLSEATLTFFVVGDGNLELSNVLNYPNPFINYTEFWFNHNKPNELLQVRVQIFTVSGKLVKTINQTVQSEGNLSRTITWDGLDDFGSKIGKGTYIYKLKVKSLNTNSTAEKVEKLVILQ